MKAAHMKMPGFRLRRGCHAGDDRTPTPAETAPAAAATDSRDTPAAGRADHAAPAAIAGSISALAVKRYSEGWHEAATDSELAFRWWVDASVSDRRVAAIGYF